MLKINQLDEKWRQVKSQLDEQVALKRYAMARTTLVVLAKIDDERVALRKMVKAIKGHVATVKNDERGHALVAALKEKYKPFGVKIRIRGRDKNRRAKMAAAGLEMNTSGDVSIKVAENIAIYANVPYEYFRES
jgi:hypothetical protein